MAESGLANHLADTAGIRAVGCHLDVDQPRDVNRALTKTNGVNGVEVIALVHRDIDFGLRKLRLKSGEVHDHGIRWQN
jgi:hypothetical protein